MSAHTGRWTRAAVAAAVAIAAAGPALAQRNPDGAGVRPSMLARDSAWWVPLSSTMVPGLGQIRLGQSRFVAYLAVEAYGLLGWANGEATVRRERVRYLALARDVARAFFDGKEAVGNWDYYESMEKHLESGVFDRTPGTGFFSPETDTATFNGTIWLRARRLSNWEDPGVEPPRNSAAYVAAVSYYATHAVRPEFRWSWRNAQLEWDDYRQSIRRKNDASRAAREHLAVVAVNHLLSTVDAFITLRLRGGLGAPRTPYRIEAHIPFP